MKSYIPEHRADKIQKINIRCCERCSVPMHSHHSKKFCGSCSDIRAEERRRANYLDRKTAKKVGG